MRFGLGSYSRSLPRRSEKRLQGQSAAMQGAGQKMEEVMSPKLAKEIQAAQDHGRQKYGRGPKDYGHDDGHLAEDWLDFIDNHNNRAAFATPVEYREELVKIAGLAVSAIESFDRKQAKRK